MRPPIHSWTIALVLLAFTPLAFAQEVLTPVFDPNAQGFDLNGLLALLQGGVQTKNWGVVIVALLIGSVWLVRLLASKFPGLAFLAWTKSTWGGWGLNLGGSTLAALLVVIARGEVSGSSTMSALIAAVVTGFASAGALEFKNDLLANAKAEGKAAGLSVVTTTDAIEELTLLRRYPLHGAVVAGEQSR